MTDENIEARTGTTEVKPTAGMPDWLLPDRVYDVLKWVALIVLAYSLFRSYSKNIAARDRENATFERIVEKPRKQLSLMRKKWTNRKTTRYFKCKGCGQVLSVPRGKGTLRVVCPKCKTETKQKS